MKKICLCLGLALTHILSVSLVAKEVGDFTNIPTKPITLNVLEVNGNNEIIFSARGSNGEQLEVNQIGIIKGSYSRGEIIKGAVIITSIQGERAKGKIYELPYFRQKYLPSPSKNIELADKVVFNSFNNRAFIIAPNFLTYELVAEKLKNVKIELIHPDIFISYMKARSKNSPTKNIITQFCPNFAIGIAVIVDSEGAKAYDCQNFRLLAQETFKVDKHDIKLPFFTRLELKKAKVGSSYKPRVKSYFPYFDKLVKN